MKNIKNFRWIIISLINLVYMVTVQAADSSGDYLKYDAPQTPAVSWISSAGYILSLLFTFVLIIGLAYFTSKFLGNKMGRPTGNNGKVIAVLPFGPNRAVYLVQFAGKYLILGVTEHSINLLQEITSEQDIAKFCERSEEDASNPFDVLLRKQLISLKQMPQKFPAVFNHKNIYHDEENEGERR